MPKRQKLRKQRKEQDLLQRRAEPRGQPPTAATAVSPLAQKILRGGQRNLEDGVTQLFMESAPLRKEREFRDLHLDSDQTAAAIARVFPQYEQRFKQAKHMSHDERQQLYDDFRIEAIEQLVTAEFRRDLLQRLGRCAERFGRTGDRERWETTTLLQGVMKSQPNIPWGICMLVITLFEEALKEATLQDREAVGFLSDQVGLLEGNSDLSELLTTDTESAKLEPLPRKLDARPGWRKRLERQAQDGLGHFEEEIYEGKYDLKLFAPGEILQALECYNEYLVTHPLLRNSTKIEHVAKPLTECIERTVREIATPQRIQQLVKDAKQTARGWLRQGKPEGILLEVEGRLLADDQTPENYFLYILFAGQLRRMSKEQHDRAEQQKS